MRGLAATPQPRLVSGLRPSVVSAPPRATPLALWCFFFALLPSMAFQDHGFNKGRAWSWLEWSP